MPLLALCKSNSAAVNEFSIEQVVAAAGSGELKDRSACSTELGRRSPLSLRNFEDLVAERGIDISHLTVRFLCGARHTAF